METTICSIGSVEGGRSVQSRSLTVSPLSRKWWPLASAVAFLVEVLWIIEQEAIILTQQLIVLLVVELLRLTIRLSQTYCPSRSHCSNGMPHAALAPNNSTA